MTATTPRIVVGIDGSESATHALGWALQHAVAIGADVDVVGAWQRPFVLDAGGYVAPYIADEDMEAATKAAVDRAIADRAADVDAVRAAGRSVVSRVMMGPAFDVLETESKTADLIVVGRRGHHRMARLLGSTSRHVADHAVCPVVVVPEV